MNIDKCQTLKERVIFLEQEEERLIEKYYDIMNKHSASYAKRWADENLLPVKRELNKIMLISAKVDALYREVILND